MRYECVKVDLDFLRKAIEARGMTERQFAILMWGEDTHRTINDFIRRPNTTIETAMKVCNILDISLDDFFGGSDKIGASPFIVGNQNIINSSVVNQDPKSLQAENRALRMLIKEKDERIADLKKVKDELGKACYCLHNVIGQSPIGGSLYNGDAFESIWLLIECSQIPTNSIHS